MGERIVVFPEIHRESRHLRLRCLHVGIRRADLFLQRFCACGEIVGRGLADRSARREALLTIELLRDLG